jgi:UDP-N-acetylmuramoyl-L-alanyl-D-glutamate--2,6-diaminopimelate ligase
MGRVAAQLADEIVVTNDNPRTESPQRILDDVLTGVDPVDRPRVLVEPDRRNAIDLAIDHGGPGDVVLLAGKGHETYQIIGTEYLPFNDRQVAVEALRRRRAGGRAATG